MLSGNPATISCAPAVNKKAGRLRRQLIKKLLAAFYECATHIFAAIYVLRKQLFVEILQAFKYRRHGKLLKQFVPLNAF